MSEALRVLAEDSGPPGSRCRYVSSAGRDVACDELCAFVYASVAPALVVVSMLVLIGRLLPFFSSRTKTFESVQERRRKRWTTVLKPTPRRFVAMATVAPTAAMAKVLATVVQQQQRRKQQQQLQQQQQESRGAVDVAVVNIPYRRYSSTRSCPR